MNQELYQFFTRDHHRIEQILKNATANLDEIDMELYNDFRIHLLTHIKMEEKVFFPAAQLANDGIPLPLAAKLRLDHGALTSLVVIPPTAEVIKVIVHILEKHDLLEEAPDGMYDVCEQLTKNQTAELIERLKSTTLVPVHPCNPHPLVLGAAKRAVERAGFDYDEIVRA